MRTNFIWVLVAVVVFVGLGFMLVKSMDAQEVVDCLQWQKDAKQLSGFYLAQWQADQCAHHQVTVDAPIHE